MACLQLDEDEAGFPLEEELAAEGGEAVFELFDADDPAGAGGVDEGEGLVDLGEVVVEGGVPVLGGFEGGGAVGVDGDVAGDDDELQDALAGVERADGEEGG